MTWTGSGVVIDQESGHIVATKPYCTAYRLDTGAAHATVVQATTAGAATWTDLADGVQYLGAARWGHQTTLFSISITAASLPSGAYGSPVSVSSANADGTAATLARSNHVHTIATGVVTSDMIANGTIVNDDISASAGIVVSKLAGGTFPAGTYTVPGLTSSAIITTPTINSAAGTFAIRNATNASNVATFPDSANAVLTNALTVSAYGAGILHSSSAGVITSSTIVNADVASGAAIVASKIAAGSFGAGAYTFPSASSVTIVGTGNALVVDTSTLVVDATNDRVGVGTASPSVALHVVSGTSPAAPFVGSSTIAGAGGTARHGVLGQTTDAGYWGGVFYSNATSGAREVDLAGGTYAALFNGGNVGIGTTAPTAGLDVAAGTGLVVSRATYSSPGNHGGAIEFSFRTDEVGYINSYSRSGAAYRQLQILGASLILYGANGTKGIAIDTNGKVLMNTAATTSGLNVGGSVGAYYSNGGSSSATLQGSDGTNAGYVEIFRGSGARCGYMGYYTNGDLYVTPEASGTFRVSGALAKTSGSFLIPHPDPAKTDTWDLRHSFVESPTRGDNLYRFRVTARSAGEVIELELPSYYRWLNENSDVWVSPVGHFGSGWGYVSDSGVAAFIHCKEPGEYVVLIIGTRKDYGAKRGFDQFGVEYQLPDKREVVTGPPIRGKL